MGGWVDGMEYPMTHYQSPIPNPQLPIPSNESAVEDFADWDHLPRVADLAADEC